MAKMLLGRKSSVRMELLIYGQQTVVHQIVTSTPLNGKPTIFFSLRVGHTHTFQGGQQRVVPVHDICERESSTLSLQHGSLLGKTKGWLFDGNKDKPSRRKHIMDHAATEMKARLFKPARSAAMYPRMEEELTQEWKARRAKSRKVSPRWMQIRSRHLRVSLSLNLNHSCSHSHSHSLPLLCQRPPAFQPPSQNIQRRMALPAQMF